MKNLYFTLLFIGIMIGGGCQKKEADFNPICMESAKEILKKDAISFYKGTISKALLNKQSISIILNQENGAVKILDNSCNILYGCCGHTCDCSRPTWLTDIKNEQVVLDVK